MSKLHPECERLWQRPKDGFLDSDKVWYCNSPVGEKKLGTFLSNLSKSLNFATIYTNHSIRATGASILSKCMFGPSQVMAVTGHKSMQSLSVYQRVSDQEKIQMGESLTANIMPGSLQAIMPRKSVPAIMPVVSRSSSIDDMALDQGDDLYGDFTVSNEFALSMPVNRNNLQSLFQNCRVTINNLTVNQK